jgi:RNA polymerase sigma-70 factor (ECF subfamily)
LKTTVAFDEEDHDTAASPDSANPESLLIEQANRATMQEALAELQVQFREILLLCEVEEMSYQEISETLSIPLGTVMSRLHRARAALRCLLQKKLQGDRHGM